VKLISLFGTIVIEPESILEDHKRHRKQCIKVLVILWKGFYLKSVLYNFVGLGSIPLVLLLLILFGSWYLTPTI